MILTWAIIALAILLFVALFGVWLRQRKGFYQKWLPQFPLFGLYTGLFLEVVALLCIGTAAVISFQEQQTQHSQHSLPQLYVLLDVSSPQAESMEAKPFWQNAKQELKALPQSAPSIRLGLIPFARVPLVYTAPTTDTALWLHQLKLANPQVFADSDSADLRRALTAVLRELSTQKTATARPCVVSRGVSVDESFTRAFVNSGASASPFIGSILAACAIPLQIP